jgi:hypothetical protein
MDATNQQGQPRVSAVERGLGVNELLEHILTHTDTRTLLVSAQRVYRRWHNVIQASPECQKQLFMIPETEQDRESGDCRSNPFLQYCMPFFFDVPATATA